MINTQKGALNEAEMCFPLRFMPVILYLKCISWNRTNTLWTVHVHKNHPCVLICEFATFPFKSKVWKIIRKLVSQQKVSCWDSVMDLIRLTADGGAGMKSSLTLCPERPLQVPQDLNALSLPESPLPAKPRERSGASGASLCHGRVSADLYLWLFPSHSLSRRPTLSVCHMQDSSNCFVVL